MRVLIVDDEPAAWRRLAGLLADLDVEVAGQAENGVHALELIRDLRPDVVLLDVAMPEVDGFDVARRLPEPRPLLIFQTAFGARALEAFEHEAVDYVLKPVTARRLEQALERARRRLQSQAGQPLSTDALRRIQMALGRGRERRPRILVRHGAGHRLVTLRDVARFSAEEGLVYATTTAGRHLTDYTLAELEERAGGFVRVSRGELVNLDRVDRIASNGDGSATLTLADGSLVHVSRRRAADVREVLDR